MPPIGELIQIERSRISFPPFCPVCGNPATSKGIVPAISQIERRKARFIPRPSTVPFIDDAYSSHFPTRGVVSRFIVPTCEAHAISFEEAARYRGPMSLCNGLMILLTVAIAIWIWLRLGEEFPIDSSTYIILGLVIGVAFLSYWASGPNALERTISVYDILSGSDIIILNISNDYYADELIRLNPMISKRVKLRVD